MRLSSSARAALFAPLEPTGRAEAIVRRLSDAMALGLLVDGEQLPSESELAERFGVAVATVREALTALRGDELVVTRRGRGGGSFVRTGGAPVTAVLRSRLEAMGLSELRDLADHYAAVSSAAAGLAAERADNADSHRLAEVNAVLRSATSTGARRKAEGQFHLEVAAAAQSPRLTRAELDLQPEVGPVLWLAHAEPGVAECSANRHDEIVAAIVTADPDRARSAARRHVGDLLAAVRRLKED